MLQPLLFLSSFCITITLQQLIGAPQLDCRRVHPSFCCTSRIRSLCPNECSTVPCGPEYYQRLYSTDLNSGSSARDGNAAPHVIAGDSQIGEEKPEETVIVDITTAASPTSTFPTLIPFEPNIDEIPTQDKDTVWTTPPPSPAVVVTQAPRKGKTPDPRIIKPPDASLVLIGDYEDADDSIPTKPLNCCRQKNLPPGCQALCRYDITQAEVRAAMDRGQCGLLRVAPFLECASQGNDNSECCQAEGVPQKTGPQCLQSCRSQGGITALGLQQVVCGNAIGEMLQCHHSGIRA